MAGLGVDKAVVVVGNRVLGVDIATLGVDIIVLDVDKTILGVDITILIRGGREGRGAYNARRLAV